MTNKRKIIGISFLLIPFWVGAQSTTDTIPVFKKRVLETTEIDFLTSYYAQDGKNASVTGGIGTEELTNFATSIHVSIPLNLDDVFVISGIVSAYTSASSSNLNPFPYDDDNDFTGAPGSLTGTPWLAASGASRQDTWTNVNVGYNHSSDDRNLVYSGNLSFATEYDYTSIGGGVGLMRLFNDKNTQISLNASVFLDTWHPQYPIELKTYISSNGNMNAGIFNGTRIYNQEGNQINKYGPDAWRPLNNQLIDTDSRNSYALSIGFSQILSKTTQFSVFSDITYQSGWLANPMQRVYFADIENFFIGNPASIPIYTDPQNTDVFQLADDIERLPNTRIKIPIGMMLNHYINEFLVLRTYYRYYFDDWGISSHTLNAELAIKIAQKFTIYPNYRYYSQTAADYFGAFDVLLSTSDYYTSDYDLSKFYANQFGLGLKYTDIFASAHLWKLRLKSLSLDYNVYERNTGLKAQIVSLGAHFIFQ
jgi:hypothetical protein